MRDTDRSFRSGQVFQKGQSGPYAHKRRWTGKPINVAPEKEIRERGGMGVGQGSKENGKKDCSWRHFLFKKHRTFVTRDKNGVSL